MPSYPAVIDSPDTTMQGGSFVATNDHALDHRTLGSAVIGIETTMGTTPAGTLFSAFAVNDKPVRHQGGTLQQVMTGTVNLAGGTITGQIQNNGTVNGTFGTPTLLSPKIIIGSDAQGDVYYRNSGGSVSRLGPGTSGQFLQTQGANANPAWANVSTPTISIVGTIADSDSDTIGTNAWATVIAATFTPSASATILLMGNAQITNNNASAYGFLRLALDGSQIGVMGRADVSGASKIQTIALQGTFAGLSAAAHVMSLQVNNTDGGGAGASGTAAARRSSLTAYIIS